MSAAMLHSIEDLNRALRETRCTRAALLDEAAQRAAQPEADAVFLQTSFDSARAVCAAADAAALAGKTLHPLAGLPVSVKDLFDIAGDVTRAGAVVRDDAAPASRDAPVIARLRAVGAALVGRTNMTEFAFSGVGINPHFGTPVNPHDRATARICGGSSSGAAASVALGTAVVALGSDTGGSIRIPAALCGLTGFKPTARRVPLQGAFPLSYSLDTACAMARTVADCVVVDGVIADAPVLPELRQPRALRLAVPRQLMLDDMDDTVAAAFDRVMARLQAAGVTVESVDLPELLELSVLNAQGGLTAAEAYAIHRGTLSQRRAGYDPRVAARIDRGASIGAADYVDLVRARADWGLRMQARLAPYDALICPTVPVIAPELAPLIEDDKLFARTNALLLRNPSVINFFDGCSISIPCHAPDTLPVGVMLSHGPMQDGRLLGTALALESLIRH